MGDSRPAGQVGSAGLEEACKRGLLLGLGWVNDQLQEFRIGDGSPPIGSPNAVVSRLKPISELALTVWILKRCGITLPALDRLSGWIWEEIRRGHYLVELLLARNDFLPACALYAPLYRMGYRSGPLDVVIRMLVASDMAAALPMQPWSRLGMAYNLWHLGVDPRPHSRGRGLVVSARPEPWVVSGDIAYAITHEVLYLSDFGFSPLRDARIVDYLRTWVPYWTGIFINEGDADLAGEFAMVLSCINSRSVLMPDHPLLYVLHQQSADGWVRGPEGSGTFLYSEADPPSRRAFLDHYHTTLVMLMAAAMALRLCQQEIREDS